MPELTTVSWFPVVTLLLGFFTKSLSDWAQHRHTTEREREAREAARREQRFQQRIAFQRQTLLDLQDALMQLARTTGEMHFHDKKAFRETGRWQKQLYGEDLAERDRVANARTAMLGVRVADASVRDLLQQFKNQCTASILSENEEASECSLRKMGLVFESLNQRIGEILRKLEEDEEANDGRGNSPISKPGVIGSSETFPLSSIPKRPVR